MKKLIRILPFVASVWVAMYVSKGTGKIKWSSDYTVKWDAKEKRYKPRLPTYWQTKQQCMKVASESYGNHGKPYYIFHQMVTETHLSPKDYKPVCYRLTKYSTR